MMTKYSKAIDMLYVRKNRTAGYRDTQSKQPLGTYSSVKMLRHTVLCICDTRVICIDLCYLYAYGVRP